MRALSRLLQVFARTAVAPSTRGARPGARGARRCSTSRGAPSADRERHGGVAAGDPEPSDRTRSRIPVRWQRVLAEGAPRRLAGSAAGDLLRAGRFTAEPDVIVLLPAGPPAEVGPRAGARGLGRARAVGGRRRDAAAFASVPGRASPGPARRRSTPTQVARQSALARAAKALNESLDLTRSCRASARRPPTSSRPTASPSTTAAPRRDSCWSLERARRHGRPAREPGTRLAGRAIASGQPAVTNDYQREVQPSPEGPFHDVRSALAARDAMGRRATAACSGWAPHRHVVRETDSAARELRRARRRGDAQRERARRPRRGGAHRRPPRLPQPRRPARDAPARDARSKRTGPSWSVVLGRTSTTSSR